MAKVYVNVFAKFDKDGNVTPVWLEWIDGTIYEIKRIMTTADCAGREMGEKAQAYTVQIGCRTTMLSYEDPRWFVEQKST